MVVISQRGGRNEEVTLGVSRGQGVYRAMKYIFLKPLAVFYIFFLKCTLELACQIPLKNDVEIFTGVALNIDNLGRTEIFRILRLLMGS